MTFYYGSKSDKNPYKNYEGLDSLDRIRGGGSIEGIIGEELGEVDGVDGVDRGAEILKDGVDAEVVVDGVDGEVLVDGVDYDLIIVVIKIVGIAGAVVVDPLAEGSEEDDEDDVKAATTFGLRLGWLGGGLLGTRFGLRGGLGVVALGCMVVWLVGGVMQLGLMMLAGVGAIPASAFVFVVGA